ncbi:P2Y purinoceptor 14-like isoform X2 [Protopterus annectens]|nr:P2Y purinoceptor 14-like isoform X2 [Protopterus annectens]XP_043926489.1 P2Y purinoceptor 14-like isoform X2 [Protopterus annectens]
MYNYSSTSNMSDMCLGNGRSFFTTTLLPVIYSLLFIGSLIMNSIAAWIFFQTNSKKSYVVFLKNIVVADLVMTSTFPFTVLNYAQVSTNVLNQIVCRFSAVVFYSTMYISIILLALISLERYIKIVKLPEGNIFQNVKYSQIITIVVWVFMFSITVPNMIMNKNNVVLENRMQCASLKTDLGLKWHKFSTYFSMFIFWTTFILMVICYTFVLKAVYESHKNTDVRLSGGKRKSRRNIFCILGVFFICFVPYHVSRIPFTLSQTEDVFNCRTDKALFYVKEGTLLVSAANVCLDPIIYFLLCKSFTKSVLQNFRILQKKRKMSTVHHVFLKKVTVDSGQSTS